MYLGLLHRRFALLSSKEFLSDDENHLAGVVITAVISGVDRDQVAPLLVDCGRKMW